MKYVPFTFLCALALVASSQATSYVEHKAEVFNILVEQTTKSDAQKKQELLGILAVAEEALAQYQADHVFQSVLHKRRFRQTFNRYHEVRRLVEAGAFEDARSVLNKSLAEAKGEK